MWMDLHEWMDVVEVGYIQRFGHVGPSSRLATIHGETIWSLGVDITTEGSFHGLSTEGSGRHLVGRGSFT